MRALAFVALSWLLLLPIAAIGANGKHAECSALEPDQDTLFDGRTLREIADIDSPELRRANRLLTARCFDDAGRAIDAYAAAHPDDYKVVYLGARQSWMTGHAAEATAMLNDAIVKSPDFASAYILMAGMAIAAEDYSEANRLLAIADPMSANDLWLFLDHLRVAAATSPDAATTDQIVRIMDDEGFRRAVRLDMAVRVLGPLSTQADPKVLDRAYRLNLEIGDQPYPNRVAPYAVWLIESEHRTDEARRLLEPLLLQPLDHPEDIRELIAESWLFDAAAIDPMQTPRNFALVENARNVLGGNIDVIARAAALNPALEPLHGFFGVDDNVDAKDK